VRGVRGVEPDMSEGYYLIPNCDLCKHRHLVKKGGRYGSRLAECEECNCGNRQEVA